MDFAKIFNFIAPQQRKRSYSFRAETSQDMDYLGIALGELFSEFAKVTESFSIGLNGLPAVGKSTLARKIFDEITDRRNCDISWTPTLNLRDQPVVGFRRVLTPERQYIHCDASRIFHSFWAELEKSIPEINLPTINIVEHAYLVKKRPKDEHLDFQCMIDILQKYGTDKDAPRVVIVDFNADIMDIPYMDEVFLPATRFLRLEYDADKDVHLGTAVSAPLQLQANSLILDYAA